MSPSPVRSGSTTARSPSPAPGRTYVITLAQPITTADRLTFTIASSTIATYTRRLDVLPGDVNDDGVVNTTDGLLILRNETPAHPYRCSMT